MQDNDLLFMKVQAIEKYAQKNTFPPQKVVKLFKTNDVFSIIEKHYDVLHTQSSDYIIEYVEDIVRRNRGVQRN